jgi:hypothetical protein
MQCKFVALASSTAGVSLLYWQLVLQMSVFSVCYVVALLFDNPLCYCCPEKLH